MLDFPAIGRSLSDLGGFALFLVAVVVAVVGLFRRQVVMGWVYDRLDGLLTLLTTQLDRTTKVSEEQSAVIAAQQRTIESQQRTIEAMSWGRSRDVSGHDRDTG